MKSPVCRTFFSFNLNTFYENNNSAYCFKYLYDVCMVLSFKTGRLAFMESNCFKLDYCFFRILFNGASKPLRLCKRFIGFSAKNDTRSNNINSLYLFRSTLSKRAFTLEIPCQFCLFNWSGIFYVHKEIWVDIGIDL